MPRGSLLHLNGCSLIELFVTRCGRDEDLLWLTMINNHLDKFRRVKLGKVLLRSGKILLKPFTDSYNTSLVVLKGFPFQARNNCGILLTEGQRLIIHCEYRNLHVVATNQ